MLKGSGWANWESYSRAVLAALEPFLTVYHRLPSRREMVDRGHLRLLSAARHHHGGWASVLRRLSLDHQPRKVRPRNTSSLAKPVWLSKTSQTPFGHWTSRAHRETILRGDSSYRRGIMPSSSVIRQSFPGLKSQIDLSPNRWNQLAIELGVLPRSLGSQGWRTGLLIIEILRRYEQLRRWPRQTELRRKNLARRRGYRHDQPLTAILTKTIFPVPMLRLVTQRLEQHLHWRARHQPQAIAESRSLLNLAIGLTARTLTTVSV